MAAEDSSDYSCSSDSDENEEDIGKALFAAAGDDDLEKLKALLLHPKANPCWVSSCGTPVLQKAVDSGNLGAVAALLDVESLDPLPGVDGEPLLITIIPFNPSM